MVTVGLILMWVAIISLIVWRLRVERRNGVRAGSEAVSGRFQSEAEVRRSVQNPGNGAGMTSF